MANLRQGVGGYGGIISLNCENRQGPYLNHSIVRSRNHKTDLYEVRCLKCGLEWTHAPNDAKCPGECRGKRD